MISDQPRVLIVGEWNPHGQDQRWALYDEPAHCAGGRLRAILGLRRPTYLSLGRRNLCVGEKWSMREARAAADEIAGEETPDWEAVIMLGAKVREAFSLTDKCPFFESWMEFVSLPHPSGRNLVWNDPARAVEARALLKAIVPSIPWGELDARAALGA